MAEGYRTAQTSKPQDGTMAQFKYVRRGRALSPPTNHPSSEDFSNLMDTRVKPAYDDLGVLVPRAF